MDWKAIISTVAPWIGTALGGPLGGMAVSAVGDALGLSDKTETSIKQALSGVTPEQMLALKNADQAFAVKMQELGFENEQALQKISADDRNSARQREVAVKDRIPGFLALGITLGFFGILGYMLESAVPDSNRDVLNIMLGSLGTAWISVVAYYFGSSSGSAVKTALLARAQPVENG